MPTTEERIGSLGSSPPPEAENAKTPTLYNRASFLSFNPANQGSDRQYIE